MMFRVVVDTNVFISSLLSTRGATYQLMEMWKNGRFHLITSPYLVNELTRVLTYPRIAKRLRVTGAETATIIQYLLANAEMMPGTLQLPGVTRDPKDDAVVACAQEGNADYIVSGDDDLLVLEEFQGIQMIRPTDFIELFG